jgi:MFS family permease
MKDIEDSRYHSILRAHPISWAVVGVMHTLLTAGIVFGWASLLPILRDEGLNLSSTDFTRIFTFGAVGNYLSTLPFGIVLDRFGPKVCGILGSSLFALGLLLCSQATENATALTAGFALLGFAGPAIQLPTLHLARLFPSDGGGGALIMSAQAAAFDGGTVVFALFGLAAQNIGLQSSTFFNFYAGVPVVTFLTAVFVWPNTILPDGGENKAAVSMAGAGSPFLTPSRKRKPLQPIGEPPSKLVDAPLSTIMSQPQFYCLALWVSIHILKLNFVVATINDQLSESLTKETTATMINVFGAMLPFGFVGLPIVAGLLNKSPMAVFQLANIVGILYGSILTFYPGNIYLQCLIVFPAVATSRQMVYSTVFHQTGELFGFANYGVLLGLTNVAVSVTSMIQNPLVAWAESSGSYLYANLILDLATIPLFVLVQWTASAPESTKEGKNAKVVSRMTASESTGLLEGSNMTRIQSFAF